MLRTIITPTNNNILLSIPNKYVGKAIEVTFLALEELQQQKPAKEKQLTSKALLISEVKEAVEEMKLIRAGKKKARNAEDFLNEL